MEHIKAFLLCLCLSRLYYAKELDCSSLNIRAAKNAVSGSTLPYCQTDKFQCCTIEYLENKETNTRLNLSASLREEFMRGNFEILSSTVMSLENFYNAEFFPDFASKMPLMTNLKSASRQQMINSLVSNLTDGLNASSNFNFSVYFETFLDALQSQFIDDYLAPSVIGGLNPARKNCLQTLLKGHTNATIKQSITHNIDQLLNYYTAIDGVEEWYEKNFIQFILQISLPSQCVGGFITLECDACFRNISPLCQSACSYITQGCFAPFRQGLSAQFDILWNTTRLIVRNINETLPKVYLAQENLLPINFGNTAQFSSFASEASGQCNTLILPSPGRKRRSLNSFTMLPNSIITNVTLLSGAFTYEGGLPLFCNANPAGMCWNGTKYKEINNVDTLDDSIENQDMNPAVSFNRTELVEIAKSIGTPVSSFLENALAGLDIEIPEGEIFQLTIEPRQKQTPLNSATTRIASIMPSFSSSLASSSDTKMSTSSMYHPSPTTTDTTFNGGSLCFSSLFVISFLLVLVAIA